MVDTDILPSPVELEIPPPAAEEETLVPEPETSSEMKPTEETAAEEASSPAEETIPVSLEESPQPPLSEEQDEAPEIESKPPAPVETPEEKPTKESPQEETPATTEEESVPTEPTVMDESHDEKKEDDVEVTETAQVEPSAEETTSEEVTYEMALETEEPAETIAEDQDTLKSAPTDEITVSNHNTEAHSPDDIEGSPSEKEEEPEPDNEDLLKETRLEKENEEKDDNSIEKEEGQESEEVQEPDATSSPSDELDVLATVEDTEAPNEPADNAVADDVKEEDPLEVEDEVEESTPEPEVEDVAETSPVVEEKLQEPTPEPEVEDPPETTQIADESEEPTFDPEVKDSQETAPIEADNSKECTPEPEPEDPPESAQIEADKSKDPTPDPEPEKPHATTPVKEATSDKPTLDPEPEEQTESIAKAEESLEEASTAISEHTSDPEPVLVTPRSTGISFAEAFGSGIRSIPKITSSPVQTSDMVLQVPDTQSVLSPLSVTGSVESEVSHSVSSHSALSASRNKKAAGLISKYQEKVAHEPLPGDAISLKKPSWHRRSYSPTDSPSSERVIKEKIATNVELEKLPDMNSVRAKFELTSSRSSKNFEFGESFRQKKRHEQLSEKERKEEAKIAIRGFNEKILNGGRTATAEIDTSNLPKSFTFDISSSGSIMPTDGVCRVNYKAADYHAKVFVVHPTRGMLLLQDKGKSSSLKLRKKKTVPGGIVKEDEFLAAALISGSPQVQLQIAAREAAARHLYESTGLDIRQQAERLKPAVLSASPTMNTTRGFQYLRNENDNKLYYFLQVDESDFVKLKEAQQSSDDSQPGATKLTRPSSEDLGDDPAQSNRRLQRPTEDSGDAPVELRISSDYSGFEFVHDPIDASNVLKTDGNDAATALSMIMNAASREIKSKRSKESTGPDAKATEHPTKSLTDDDDIDETQTDGKIRTVGEKRFSPKTKGTTPSPGGKTTKPSSTNGNSFYDEEAKLNIKPSTDTADDVVAVSCCCSFW